MPSPESLRVPTDAKAFSIRHSIRVSYAFCWPSLDFSHLGSKIPGVNTKRVYSVVLTDDSEDDRFFLRRAIAALPRFKLIQELTDGTQVVDYLTGNAPYGNRSEHPIPDLLLLDLKMPHMTGYEVLRWLQPRKFGNLTVIVLSGSQLQEDVETSLACGAHGYWTKTGDPKKQKIIASEIEALLDGRCRIAEGQSLGRITPEASRRNVASP